MTYLQKGRNGFSPDLFKKEIQAASAKLNQTGDSLIQIYTTSPKAIHLIKTS